MELTLDTNIKEWYTTNNPEDHLALMMSGDYSFRDLFNFLQRYTNVDDFCEILPLSEVREEAFKALEILLKQKGFEDITKEHIEHCAIYGKPVIPDTNFLL